MSVNFRDYRFGAKGDHVKRLQQALIDAGYSLPEYGADGWLGSETMRAVQQLEADHGFVNSLSWVIDATTLGVLLHPSHPTQPPLSGVPIGKGMFQRTWSHMGSTPGEMTEHLREHGITWVAIQRLWQYENPSDDKWYNGSGYNGYDVQDWIDGITAADAMPWVWGWPHPGREDDFIEAMQKVVQEWGVTGIIADCEKPWYEEGDTSNHAHDLVTGLKALGVPVGITSYGAPWNFPGLPWSEFVQADFGIPQIYDSNNTMPDDYPERSVYEWQEMGFNAVVPASAAYNKTESQMRDLLDRTPTPDGAITWWDWYNANQASYRWRVIEEYRLPENMRARA